MKYLDPSRIRISNDTKCISDVLKLIDEKNMTYLNNDENDSLLIESILLRVPISTFVINYSKYPVMEVAKGNKRISFIYNFVNNNFKLENIEFLNNLEGLYYKDLPRNYQRRILEYYLDLKVIDAGTPIDVVNSLIRRFNS